MSASKNKNFPLVSVIVRTKDRTELLREALESLATQSYPYIEAVVVNDGGVDVWPIVEEFADRLYRVKYIAHKENRGRAAAANTGLHATEGEWVGLLDDDDLLLPKAIETLVWHGKAASAVYGQVEIIRPHPDGPGEIIAIVGQPFSRESLFINNYIPTCGLIFKRHLALKIGGFDEKFSLLEDWDFIYRLARETDFLFIPQKVALYRIFGRGFIADRDFRKEAPWRERFYRKHLPEINATFLAKGYFDFVENQEKVLFILQQKLFEDLKHEREKFIQAFKGEQQKFLEEISQERDRLEEEKKKLVQALQKESQEKKKLAQALQKESQERERLAQELKALFSSKSWRITAPLRWLGFKARRAKGFCERYAILVRKFWSHTRTFGLRAALEKTRLWLSSRKTLPITPCYPALSPSEAEQILENLSYKPLISVIVPVYNTPEPFLRACLESVFNQYYPHWELCIADDASTEPHVRSVLEEFRQRAPNKIKIAYRETNGHISVASNTALSLATGEFIALLDHDDELTPDALLEVVSLLNKHPEADMIYSDEDKISPTGEYIDPYFKPDWSPELFLGQMYTCHLGVYRRSIIEEIGGFRKGFEGSQDYDLVLRFTERTNNIFHIPKVLYHWRIHAASAAGNQNAKPYAYKAALKAIEEALQRRKEPGWVEPVKNFHGMFLVHFYLRNNPLISIIIPTKDQGDYLERCISSIVQKTSYKNYEFIIIDSGSKEEKTFKIFEYWQKKLKGKFKVLKYNIPFNFSKIVNYGVENSQGDLILLLRNNTELIAPKNWLEEMGGYAQRKDIGCVSCILLFPDNSIQHAGIILGLTPDPEHIPAVAGHAYYRLSANNPGYFGRLKVVSNYAAVTRNCLMIKRNLWEEVKGFDENLGIAYNDIDFCLKLLQKGYRHVVLPHVRFYYKKSQTKSYRDSYQKEELKKEIEIIYLRWKKLIEQDPYYNPNLTKTKSDFSLAS